MTPFTLGRMRLIELLELWHYLHPDGHHGTDGDKAARMTHDGLAALILSSA